MNKFTLTTLLLMTILSVVAAASNNEDVKEMKERAENASERRQADMFTKVAELQLQQFSKYYDEGDAGKAEDALRDVLEYGVRAAQTSQETGRRMKQTEIAIRKMTNRLEDISRTLAYDDRQVVNSTIEELETARTGLLHHIFSRR